MHVVGLVRFDQATQQYYLQKIEAEKNLEMVSLKPIVKIIFITQDGITKYVDFIIFFSRKASISGDNQCLNVQMV